MGSSLKLKNSTVAILIVLLSVVVFAESSIPYFYAEHKTAPGSKFRRVEVVGGDVLPENTSLQEGKSGLQPGQLVVTNALVLDHVLGQ